MDGYVYKTSERWSTYWPPPPPPPLPPSFKDNFQQKDLQKYSVLTHGDRFIGGPHNQVSIRGGCQGSCGVRQEYTLAIFSYWFVEIFISQWWCVELQTVIMLYSEKYHKIIGFSAIRTGWRCSNLTTHDCQPLIIYPIGNG